MAETKKKYTMDEGTAVAKRASRDIENYLRRKPETISVENVEDNKDYRERDIDLVWEYGKGGIARRLTIEIKGDRYYKTGNYVFETTSNVQRGTPGCFMYSEAEYLFYYFVDARELHIIPLERARAWFIEHINEFDIMMTTTPCGNGEHYNTEGRLIPRERLKAEVNGVKVINLP